MTTRNERRTKMESVLELAKSYAEVRDMIRDHTGDTSFMASDNAIERQASSLKELQRIVIALREDLGEMLAMLLPMSRTSEGMDVSIRHGNLRESELGLPVTEALEVQFIYNAEPETVPALADDDEEVDEVTVLVAAARAKLRLVTSRIAETEFTVKLDDADIID